MAGAADKTIKVTIVVDQAAADKAKRAILEIKQQVDALVKSTSQLGNFLGSGFTKVGAQASQPGTSPMTQITQSRAGGGGALAGVTQALAGGAVQSAAAIKVSTAAAMESYDKQKQGLKSLVAAQEQDVKRLQGMWKNAADQIGGYMRRIFGGTKAAGGGAPGVSSPPAAAGGGGAGGGGPTTLGKGLPGGQNGFLSQIAGAFGVPTGMVGVGGAVLGGARLASAAIGASYSNERANAQLDMERSFFGVEARARVGQTLGQNSLAIRHGDMARAYALQTLASDKNFQDMSSQHRLLRREQALRLETPTDLAGHIGKEGVVSGSWNTFKNWAGGKLGGDLSGAQINGSGRGIVGRGTNWLGRQLVNDPLLGGAGRYLMAKGGGDVAPGTGNVAADTAQQELARGRALAQAAEDRQRYLEADIASRPGFNDRINAVYNRNVSDSQLFRALGMSGRDIVRKLADGTTERMNAATEIRSRAAARGYTEGDFASAAGQITQFGRGYLGHYGSVLSPQAGGLTNAAEILGMSGQFGKFGGLMGGIQSMIGGRFDRTGNKWSGGLDTTAGAQMSGLGFASMRGNFLSGMTGQGGTGLMETLMTAAYTGGGSGADMYQSSMVQAGLGRRQQEAAGGVDPLNKALNINAVMKAAPEAPWAVKNLILGMDETQLMDIVKGGRGMMPKMLLNNGISYDMVVSYWQARNATSFARAGRTKEYGNADQRSVVEQYTKAGGLGFLKGKSAAEQAKILDQLAAMRAGPGGDPKAHRGALELELSAAGLKAKPKGTGAGHAVAKDSVTGQANAAHARIEHEVSKKEANESGVYGKTYGKAYDTSDEEQKAADAAQKGLAGGANMGQAVMDVSKALNNFVTQLQNVVKSAGSPKAGPAGKAR